ncbi:MAG: ATP-dependent DNA helicase RecG [Trichodesmium sp. MAG_R03]|nr:ATP-dependent DNA helicase RecG [Trichodesmium sp. MAG_R03]
MNDEKEKIDWERLKKALLVEAGNGFQNLQGKQYIFNEFLSISFSKPPIKLKAYQNQFQELSKKFASYLEMTKEEREFLLEKTQDFLNKMQSLCIREKEEYRLEINSLEVTAKIQKNNSNYSQEYTNHLALEQILKDIEGIGIKNSNRLETLGLYTVRELLFYYPRDHIDYARQVNICDLEPGETVTIIGKVKRLNCFSSPKNKKLTILEITLTDVTGQIKISRFFAGPRFSNKGWQMLQKKIYPVGATVAVSGLVKENKYGKNLDNPEIEVLDREGSKIESMKVGRLVPVYPLTEGVGADVVRRAVFTSLPTAEKIPETLPEVLINKYQLINLKNAIKHIHFPTDQDCLAAARRRLVFDEFFYLQLGLLKRRQLQKKTETAIALPVTGKLINKFYELLPFQLTNAQKRVINEILSDLKKPESMKRLVQGDVGAGKTVVAVVAMLAAIQVGYQAALMAPTEVLAEQHYRKLVTWFNLLHLPVELLTGSTKIGKRREIYSQLETGELPVLVGTHALIQDTVSFHKLGLAVIDEQHRFGVQQRAKLQQKGESPHFLAMTATPIPRTLALTLHGDLDVSQIDELPPGRQPIQTTILTGRQRKKAYDLIRREIVQGRQVYVVLPLVEESEKLDIKSAIEEHQKLADKVFPEFQIGLLHGRMSSAEKDQAISKFRDNQTQILVSTTVVEVGVDVANATVMLIENAERFGLSQLHQLRGRVGRGVYRSYCLLMRGAGSTDATERLKVLEQSQDGFFIAEMDMRLRGPGQVLGTKQSGLPDFALASLVEDQEVLELARGAALEVMEKDESLNSWPLLRKELEWRYQKMMGGSILN